MARPPRWNVATWRQHGNKKGEGVGTVPTPSPFENRSPFLQERLNPSVGRGLQHRRSEHQRDDGHDLDQDVHRWTRGVLERVTDRVANDCGLMSV